VAVFEEWLDEEPDNPIARHMLAACSGRDVPPRASDAFIEATFDSFADSFDAKLAKLLYRAPALVAEMLKQSDVDASKSLDVARCRCGTGFVYFGPLEEVVAAAAGALRPAGRLIFTVEELAGTGHEAGYSLSANGRYRHAREYVERVLAQAGLEPEIVQAELRLKAGEPVAGLVVRGTK
jgi:predicted TPR repeat methyltransferase